MNENEVMEMLAEDISRLRLPPISEKVLLAMREKRREFLEMNKPLVPTEKPHKIIPTKYIFAAMLALLAVSVPIIVVMTNHSPISDLPNAPVLPGSSEIVSVTESQIVTSTEEPKTTLEQIKLKQTYGEVALSGKSEEELEMLLVTYSKENSVYEDDRYIYNFNSYGSLVEILNKTHSAESLVQVTKKEIESTAKNIFEMYFTERDITSYKQEIISNTDTLPEWIINYKNNNDETIRMTFDKSGQLRMAILIGSGEDFGNISRAEVVEIALSELKKEKYNLPNFNDSKVDITIELRKRDNEKYYFIAINNIVVDEEITIGYYMEINAYTGKIQIIKD